MLTSRNLRFLRPVRLSVMERFLHLLQQRFDLGVVSLQRFHVGVVVHAHLIAHHLDAFFRYRASPYKNAPVRGSPSESGPLPSVRSNTCSDSNLST